MTKVNKAKANNGNAAGALVLLSGLLGLGALAVWSLNKGRKTCVCVGPVCTCSYPKA